MRDLVRAKFESEWGSELELGHDDAAEVLGELQHGITFATESDLARVAWFAFLLSCGAATLLIAIGVGGRDNFPVSAHEVVTNSSIARVLATLAIDAA